MKRILHLSGMGWIKPEPNETAEFGNQSKPKGNFFHLSKATKEFCQPKPDLK